MYRPMFVSTEKMIRHKRYRTAAKIFAAIIFLWGVVSVSAQTVSNKVPAEEEATPVVSETPELKIAEEIDKPIKATVVVDAGHGGEDPGHKRGGIQEKDISLDIALKLEEALIERGYEVITTRTEDVQLTSAERIKKANDSEAKLFVSIHQSAEEHTKSRGIETWMNRRDENAGEGNPAEYIQKSVIESTGAVDRGVVLDGEFFVNEHINMPVCLVETGFLSNVVERELLKSSTYRQKIADGIATGIDTYLTVTLGLEPIQEANGKTMYLTFDDGPSPKTTPTILDILKARNIKATFFLIGENVNKYPEIVQRIVDEGHTIGVHCNRHDYNEIYGSAESFIQDFNKASSTIESVVGFRPMLFRFPGGSVNSFNKNTYKQIIEEMTAKGYVYFDWNAEIGDSTKNRSNNEILEMAKNTVQNRKNVVLLAHDTVQGTTEILDELITMFADYTMEVLTPDVVPIQFRSN